MPILIDERILVTEQELVDELDTKGYGERNGKQLMLSPEEALYLNEKRAAFPVETKTGKNIDYKGLWKHFMKIDPEFSRKYLVYRDLRDRGYCVKTGFKFGSHYRIYARGEKPGKGHAIWLVQCIPEDYVCEFPKISGAVRLAQNVRKKMIYAVVDKEGDIGYYKMEWMTP